MTVILRNGLEEIGEQAAGRCTSLLTIPPNVRAIKERAFDDCSGLTAVTLGNGLEEIGEGAFCGYRSLICIAIPVGTLKHGYVRNVPLPKAPRIQSASHVTSHRAVTCDGSTSLNSTPRVNSTPLHSTCI